MRHERTTTTAAAVLVVLLGAQVRPCAAAEAGPEEPTAARPDAARGVLRDVIARATRTGARPEAHILFGGARPRVTLVGVEGDAVTFELSKAGTTVRASTGWKAFDDRALIGCAANVIGPADVDGLLAMLVACRAAGVENRGSEAYAKILAMGDADLRAKAKGIWDAPPPATAARRTATAHAAPAENAPDRVQPADRPSLPEAIAAYEPPPIGARGGTSASDGPPELAEWTRYAGPGDVVVVAGHRLSRYTGDKLGADAEFVVFGQSADSSGGAYRAQVLKWDERAVALRLPAKLPPSAMYTLWLRNGFGCSKPAVINQTEAWWIGPNQAARGATVSVYGRNLALHSGPQTGETSSWVYFRPRAGSGVWTKVVGVNPYKVDFVAPERAPPGEYEVWVHNGRGGAYGWSGPLAFVVDDRPGWVKTVNVREMGAAGDGRTDDTSAVMKAISRAQNGWGTVAFPAGTYLVNRTLNLGSRIRLLGAGRDASTIMSTVNTSVIRSYGKDVEIRDLRIENRHGPEFGPSGFDLWHAERVFVVNTDIVAAGNGPGNGRQLFFENCNFYGVNDGGELFKVVGGDGLSMVRCTAQDLDNSDESSGAGWCQGRFVTVQAHRGLNRNEYFEGNRTIDLTVRPGFREQNTGEQFMWEIEPHWQGTPTEATATTAKFDGLPDLPGFGAAIALGKGLGQHRRIVSCDQATGIMTVSPPWNVVPDATSLITIGGFADRIVLYRNHMDAKPRAVANPSHIAALGIQPYGGTFNLIADSNTFHELRCGTNNWGMSIKSLLDNSPGLSSPNYFQVYENNRYEGCREAANEIVGLYQPPKQASVLLMGTIYRRNVFIGNRMQAGFRGGGKDAMMVMSVFDQNVGDGRLLPDRVYVME